jgi:hypothetical protein
MKLTAAQKSEIKTRIANAFDRRRIVTMNVSGKIGQTNFYGDEPEPKLNRTQVLDTIECALANWNQPEDKTDDEWADEIAEEIISDIL